MASKGKKKTSKNTKSRAANQKTAKKVSNKGWIQQYYQPVQIPALARIRDSRGDIAEDVETLFLEGIPRTDGERRPVRNPWVIAGPNTQHFATEILRYCKQWEDPIGNMGILTHEWNTEGFVQGHWEGIPKLVDHVKRHNIDFIVYVGAQKIADTAKAVAHERKILTGGVITAISTDGVFSDTAVLVDKNGLSQSKSMVAPYFVLGHKQTLIRSPTNMKAACAADILTNHSSLWDYDYSCAHLDLAKNDIAVQFAKSAAELINLNDLTPLRLADDEVIQRLFRATELCGLSMQLNRGFDGRPTSATCSGSEHLIEKEIKEHLVRQNAAFSLAGQPAATVALHGEILVPCLLLTLVLQGQAALMVELREAFQGLKLPTTANELKLSDDDFVKCVDRARGRRAKYFTDIEDGRKTTTERKMDRLTVLENIEKNTLKFAVKDAMQLAKIGF